MHCGIVLMTRALLPYERPLVRRGLKRMEDPSPAQARLLSRYGPEGTRLYGAFAVNLLFTITAAGVQFLFLLLSLAYGPLEDGARWALGLVCVFGAMSLIRIFQADRAAKEYSGTSIFRRPRRR
jgi:hypothetical protein